MFSVLWAFANFVVDLFKSRRRLEAEKSAPAPPAQRCLEVCTTAVAIARRRPCRSGWFGPVLARPRSFGPGGKAGDGFALVSDGVPRLLALEIAERGLGGGG